MEKNFKMVAKTFFGFEDILAKEVQQLGGQDVQTGTRVVTFSGDKGFMYKANLSLRTALKILKPIKWFKVFNDKSLYDGIEEQTQRIINQVKDLKEDYKKNLAQNQSILGQFMKNNKPNPLQNLINQ